MSIRVHGEAGNKTHVFVCVVVVVAWDDNDVVVPRAPPTALVTSPRPPVKPPMIPPFWLLLLDAVAVSAEVVLEDIGQAGEQACIDEEKPHWSSSSPPPNTNSKNE